MKRILLLLTSFVLIIIMAGCGDDKVETTSVQTEVTTESIAKNVGGEVGSLDSIYLSDKSAVNPDGSFIALNFHSVSKKATYQVNNGDTVENVIVIQNVTPIESTKLYVEKAGYFAAYGNDGKLLAVGDISTQTNGDYSEIIVFMKDKTEFDALKYVEIGGLNSEKYPGGKIVFEVSQ